MFPLICILHPAQSCWLSVGEQLSLLRGQSDPGNVVPCAERLHGAGSPREGLLWGALPRSSDGSANKPLFLPSPLPLGQGILLSVDLPCRRALPCSVLVAGRNSLFFHLLFNVGEGGSLTWGCGFVSALKEVSPCFQMQSLFLFPAFSGALITA